MQLITGRAGIQLQTAQFQNLKLITTFLHSYSPRTGARTDCDKGQLSQNIKCHAHGRDMLLDTY